MGCFDVYCFICGNSVNYTAYSDNSVEPKEIKWIRSCTMLLRDNTVVHGLEEISCGNEFHKSGYDAEHLHYYIRTPNSLENNAGIFIHTDCWKFIKINYKIELTLSNLPPLFNFKENVNKGRKMLKNSNNIHNNIHNKIFDINYGTIERYWDQFLDYDKMVEDGNIYL